MKKVRLSKRVRLGLMRIHMTALTEYDLIFSEGHRVHGMNKGEFRSYCEAINWLGQQAFQGEPPRTVSAD